MTKKLFGIAGLCGVFLFAASAAPGSRQAYPATTTVVDGVKTIQNPDFPRDGRFTAVLTGEMTWGEESGPEKSSINRPLDLQVDARGRVYVPDYGDAEIKVYEGAGGFLRTIGRKGQGPGEFNMPGSLGLLSDGRICVLDGLLRRVTVFSAEGQYESSFILADGSFRALGVDGENRLYVAKHGQQGENRLTSEFREVPFVTSIYRTDVSGKDLVHLVDFLGENITMRTQGENTLMVGGMYTIIWNVNREGKIFGGYNETCRLSAYDRDGKLQFVFGREFEYLKNPRYSGAAGQRKNLPAYNRFIVFDEEGNLWLELYKNSETKGFTYDVFSPEGIFLKQISVDERIKCFAGGRVYCLVQSEEGFSLARRYRMELRPK